MCRFWTLVLVVSLVASTGCTSAVKNTMRLSEKSSQWNPLEKLTLKRDREATSDENRPVTMAAIWKDTTMSTAGNGIKRGFGGRIYFYDQENNPVAAEGELVVYGFDNSSEDPSKPQRKFVFEPEKLSEHYSESALGGSYSFWLPWDEAGGFEKTITLIPIFKTADNRVIQSGQSINVLPGKMPKAQHDNHGQPYRYLGSSSAVIGQNSDTDQSVAQASYTENEQQYRELNTIKTRVTEIQLTKNLQKLVNNAKKADKKMEASKAPAQPPLKSAASPRTQPKATESAPAKSGLSRSTYGVPGPFYR